MDCSEDTAYISLSVHDAGLVAGRNEFVLCRMGGVAAEEYGVSV